METRALERMKELNISQVQMIKLLAQKGIVVQVAEISQMLRGLNTYPKATRVLKEVEEILDEYERAIS